MASSQNGAHFPSLSYTKVLLLGAIAAASAFVVTIFIVLLCVGCQRKARTKNAQTDTANHRMVNTSMLCQPKLRSMSKSDTRLHEMSRRGCNGKSIVKNRPASMDLLLLPRQRSNSDLQCPQGRQLPRIPPTPGEEREHTYSEVGHRSPPPRCPDDVLYESVGGGAAEPDPPPVSAPPRSPAHGNGHGNGKGSNGVPVTVMMAAPQDPVTAEYACIRKVKKVDWAPRKENGGELGEEQLYSNADLPPATPPLHHSAHQGARKPKEAFHMHPFPKETVFMGNGEQYIWKPPEDVDIAMPQHRLPSLPSMPHGESGQNHSTAVEISDMYSKVCKPNKKKRSPTSPLATEDTNGEGKEGVVGCDRVQPPLWAGAGGGRTTEDPSYEAFGDKTFPGGSEESDPAYETIDSNWKRDRPPNTTAKPKTRQQQQQQHLPLKALPSENFYESISDVKNGVTGASTTTIFTFNDGMEMYVTGL
ncbi:uncharacterized protein LOC133138157 [Conger conger]|uniref:uncharacterized protein LOC133138157 n=1 Tax=Conger conger TaxID=82655 RepID=UPI002A5ABF17|nr:uncharacterized protein LOC133138157 [Conger conger]